MTIESAALTVAVCLGGGFNALRPKLPAIVTGYADPVKASFSAKDWETCSVSRHQPAAYSGQLPTDRAEVILESRAYGMGRRRTGGMSIRTLRKVVPGAGVEPA